MSDRDIILIARDLENAINKYKSENYVDDDLLNYCRKLLKQGKIEEAVKAWNNRIPKAMAWIWGKTMQDFMEWFTEERTPAEVNLAAAKISITTQQVKNIVLASNKAFMTDVIGQYYKDLYGMTDKELYNTVLEASVSQFRTYVDGALSNTPTAILNDIRQFQLDIHEYNHLIGKSSDLSQYIDETEKMFRERMERKFPSYFQAMKDGNVIKSRWYGPNLDKVKSYTLQFTE
jgi:DNA-binding protein Fis